MKISIDGKEIETKETKTILELAKENKIYIPSLCDFKELDPFSGCRLCLVKVEGMKGYVPSCSTYVKEGMKVRTNTPGIKKLRKNILELILTEHPSACLICEEKESCDEHKATIRKVDEVTGCVLCPNNGRCELQKVVEEVGLETVTFPSVYRELEIEKDDPFFDRNYNLCILCGRCVRVCREVRGLSVISFIRRGARTVVGTNLEKPLLDSGCQFCGACVDVCPTGALTEKAVKYESPPDKNKKTVCPLCSTGCSVIFNFHENKLLNVDVFKESPVNAGQACVRGRFALRDVLQSENRIEKPLVRKNNHLEEVAWDEAIDYASKRLNKYKPDQIAVLTSPQLSCEDIFVLNQFAEKVLKTRNINRHSPGDSLSLISAISREHKISVPVEFKLDDLSDLDVLFLMGENIIETNPLVWVRILKALTKGADFIKAGNLEKSVDRYASKKLRIKPGEESYFLACLSKILLDMKGDKEFSSLPGFKEFKKSLGLISLDKLERKTGISIDEAEKVINLIAAKNKPGFIFGPRFASPQRGKACTEALLNLALLTRARVFPLSSEGNQKGWHSLNEHFLKKTESLRDIIKEVQKGAYKAVYTTVSLELPKDIHPELLIVQDSFKGVSMDRADLVLPSAVLFETDGTIVNTEGRIQSSENPLDKKKEAKPDWEIISEIAQKMGSKDFNYAGEKEIRKEMSQRLPAFKDVEKIRRRKKGVFLKESSEIKKKLIPLRPESGAEKLTQKYPLRLIMENTLDYYRSCLLSEEIPEFVMFRNSNGIKVNKKDAKKYDLKEGDSVVLESKKGKFKGIIHISESVPEGMTTAYYMAYGEKDTADWDLAPVRILRGK